jgi:2,3-dihydroxybenzoate decarboxylase
MLPTLKCPVIALEEHYWDKELAALFVGAEGVRDPEMLKRLYDLGEVRLKEMDEAGIRRGRRANSSAPPSSASRGQ